MSDINPPTPRQSRDVREFRGHENLPSGDPTIPYGLSYGFFVAVTVRGIDVSVADLEAS